MVKKHKIDIDINVWLFQNTNEGYYISLDRKKDLVICYITCKNGNAFYIRKYNEPFKGEKTIYFARYNDKKAIKDLNLLYDSFKRIL